MHSVLRRSLRYTPCRIQSNDMKNKVVFKKLKLEYYQHLLGVLWGYFQRNEEQMPDDFSQKLAISSENQRLLQLLLRLRNATELHQGNTKTMSFKVCEAELLYKALMEAPTHRINRMIINEIHQQLC